MADDDRQITVVVVAHNSAAALERTLPAVSRELRDGDQLVVVDNASDDGSVDTARRLAPEAIVIETGSNLGFAAACNAGARLTSTELIVFLNPDALPAPGFGDAIRRPARDQPSWGAWQALVTSDGGRLVNTAGNEVHVTGIAWAGQAGRRVEDADLRRREVPYLSGACLAVRRDAFDAVGGFDGWLFLYHEDLDLSLRLRLAGHELGLEPDARVDHDYEFQKGGYKWRLMERNRTAVLVRCWPAPVLVAALPLLLAAEPAVWAASVAGGWSTAKRRAAIDATRALPRLIRERRVIQRSRRIGACEFAEWLTPYLSSSYLGRLSGSRLLRLALGGYWRAATAALRAFRS
jgi:GT2 family glycosyltransferase